VGRRYAAPMLMTPRLALRPWSMDDADAFHAIWGDPEVIWWGAAATFEESRAGLERVLAREAAWPEGVRWFAVMPRDGGEILGDVLLQPAKFADGIEIGWHFRRDAWGHGFATEAARRVLRYGFDDVGLERILAIVATTNARSLRVVDKLGLAFVEALEYAGLPHRLFAIDAPVTGA
jgi:RimJ/RimL family protein N-acetyltransferase